MPEIDGATGRLFLDEDGRVRRRLVWAQFQNGQPLAMPDADNVGGPIEDISDAPEMLMPESADDETWFDATREL